MSANLDELYPYYRAELDYLRRAGGAFAAAYPNAAARIELSGEESPDPHVERLLESFAFLTARIQHRLDAQFPEITTALLAQLAPHLVHPVPPMAVAQFEPDPAQGKLHDGYLIPRESKLFAQTEEGLTCRFRTCYPVTLWPVEITEAKIEPASHFAFLRYRPQVASVLSLRLSGRGAPLHELSLRRLRVHLHGDGPRMEALYGLIFSSMAGVALRPGNAADTTLPRWLPASALQAVGFAEDEEVIPYPLRAQPATRLLQEYFHFPEKFLYFDLDQLSTAGCERSLDVLLLLSRLPEEKLEARAADFQLGCTPIINLFRRTSEPIRVDQRSGEYRLQADMRRERTTEIHSVLSVSSSSNPAEEQLELEPLFSLRYRSGAAAAPPARCYWRVRRVPAELPGSPGSDLLLSFVDLDLDPAQPPRQMAYAHLLCTNRDLAEQMPPGARLQTEEKAPLERIRCLSKPTSTAYSRLGGAALWSLVASQSLNHLSLTGPEGLETLKTMLRLYGGADSPSGRQQIEDLSALSSRAVVRRLGGDAWRGFCPGYEISLVLNERSYRAHGAYLFGAVLQHFFGLYAALNSFSELVLRTADPNAPELRYAPRAGSEALL
ncbi:MAG: type VI secretion system baseplate subunit TssF [Terriglobales bacterium]